MRKAWIREAEAAIPDPPYSDFIDYEDWSRAFHLRPGEGELGLYHSSPRRAGGSPAYAGRRPRVRELHTLVADQRLDHLLLG